MGCNPAARKLKLHAKAQSFRKGAKNKSCTGAINNLRLYVFFFATLREIPYHVISQPLVRIY